MSDRFGVEVARIVEAAEGTICNPWRQSQASVLLVTTADVENLGDKFGFLSVVTLGLAGAADKEKKLAMGLLQMQRSFGRS
ncbi:hypothetical protein CGMCC3_g16653 [Colletotrichum fructicola]|nr:uncharacterized protein CGMCC3_g16653 [Colletotrichum fructicola]KAE9567193.1 hypothetical protein CGMCC3_g16653 [Colletotrichum fructicola]